MAKPRQVKGGRRRITPLTHKEEVAIHEYIKTGNWRQSLITAGYKPDTVRKQEDEIFARPKVANEIERRLQRQRKGRELTEDFVIQRMMNLADVNMGDVLIKLRDSNYDLSVLTYDERYAIESITEEVYMEGRGDEARAVKQFKVKLSDKLPALANLARILGMFKDKVTHEAGDSILEKLQAGRQAAREANFEEVQLLEGEQG